MSLKSAKHLAIHATTTPFTLLSIVGVTVLSLASVTVRAETPAPQVTVSLQDLDLAKVNDARAAYGRLRTAARAVCEGVASRDLRTTRQHEECFQTALWNAVASVDNRSVTQLLNSDHTVRIAQRNSSVHRGT